jgi:putative PIN family toxin of toxin-antitoxin system
MRAVLDTNIIVSRYLVAIGIPARIITAWRQDRFEVVVSPALLAEYERVLNYRDVRRRHHLSPEDISNEVGAFGAAALLVEPEEVPAVIVADPADDQVLAAAVAGTADYIVSGDPHLLEVRVYRGIRILTPATFLALLAAEDQ